MKIVLFDIDYTLYDVSHFDKNFYKKLEKIVNIDEDIIRKKSIEFIKQVIEEENYLNIDKYLNLLLEFFGEHKKKKDVKKILYNELFFKNGFYQEVEKTLNYLKKIAKIGIFSQGDEEFQWAKIDQSGLKHFFDKNIIYIKHNKIQFTSFLKKKHANDEIFLVDDNPNVIFRVKDKMPYIFTIWIRRGKFAEMHKDIENFKPDAIIKNLTETIDIVKNN
ncbi:MAG: HAD family hydrolase [bacterium]|nr:HAD family hydrolase [bacterium]